MDIRSMPEGVVCHMLVCIMNAATELGITITLPSDVSVYEKYEFAITVIAHYMSWNHEDAET